MLQPPTRCAGKPWEEVARELEKWIRYITIFMDDHSLSVPAVISGLAAHLSDALAAHAASAISYSGTASGLGATNVQAAIDEIAAGDPDWARTFMFGG